MKSLCSLLIVTLLSLLAICTALPLHAAAGDLDTTFAGFGTGGKVITPFSSTDTFRDTASARGIVLQPDGKIVVAGARDKPIFGGKQLGLLVMRYLSNGTLDPTFGSGGVFTSYTFPVSKAHVALQADGKIVVAVETFEFSTFILTRLTSNGALDTTFGDTGWVTTTIGDFSVPSAILVQPDGKILAAGFANVNDDTHFAVARYNADGSLDPTFDGDGEMTVGFGGGGDDRVEDMRLQDDGKLVLVGSSVSFLFDDHDFAVARVNSNGSLDTSFDGDGKLSTGFGGTGEFAHAVALQSDGTIIVAGSNGDTALLARYLSNGDLDSSFDGDGKLAMSGLSGEIEDVNVQPDGKIVLLGYHTSPDHSEKFALYRLRSNGQRDTTFDGDGDVFIDFGGGNAEGYALGLQADGRIIGYGQSGNSIALMRLWPDASLDTGGKQVLGFDDPLFGSNTRDGSDAMALQSNGDIIVAGYIANAANTNSNFALARFLPDGEPDGSFGTFGHVSYGIGGTQIATAVAIQPDDKIVAAGYQQSGSATSSNFMVARFNVDGSTDVSFGFGGFNVLDFMGGADYAYSLALAPDGKIVLTGTVFNGARHVFGVARFNSDGTVDRSFDTDSKQLVEVTPNVTHAAKAVVVQPDGKIVVGGAVNHDFALVRLNDDGSVDGTFGNAGKTITDMGGDDTLSALAQTASGEFYAAGSRYLNTSNDFALAHYDANGVLVTCSRRCQTWASGKTFVDFGGSDVAYALDIHNDDQIFVAGCSDGLFAWTQLKATGTPVSTKGTTAFVGGSVCASGVRLVAPNKIVLAGTQIVGLDTTMALARFAVVPHADEVISGLSVTTDSPTLLGNATTLTASIASGTNVTYNWDFGDGTPTTTGASVTHTYDAAGIFTATLTASNNQGSVSTTVEVEVDAASTAPTTDTAITGLSVAASSGSTRLGDPIAFTATIMSGTNVTYSWNFGDGTPAATGANVTHTYGVAGVFTVTLTATNARGSVRTTVQEQIVAVSNQWQIYLPVVQKG